MVNEGFVEEITLFFTMLAMWAIIENNRFSKTWLDRVGFRADPTDWSSLRLIVLALLITWLQVCLIALVILKNVAYHMIETQGSQPLKTRVLVRIYKLSAPKHSDNNH